MALDVRVWSDNQSTAARRLWCVTRNFGSLGGLGSVGALGAFGPFGPLEVKSHPIGSETASGHAPKSPPHLLTLCESSATASPSLGDHGTIMDDRDLVDLARVRSI